MIENIAIDKLRHNLLGSIINPPIIAGFLIAGFLFQKHIYNINFLWFGYLGAIFCCFYHYLIEVYQRNNKTGKYEVLDAVYGSYSALKISLVIAIIHILQ